MMSDEALEFYGDIFVTAGFRTFSNITFEQFLVQPEYHIDELTSLLNG